jgi:hypothetical protein
MATRDEINEAIRAAMQEVIGRNVGLAEMPIPPDPDNPPQNWPGDSYAILYPQNTSAGHGGMADGEEDRDFLFQVTNVGRDPRQAAWMSSKVEAFFVGKKPGGGYLHDIPLDGHAVEWRLVDSIGAILPGGDESFTSADQYRLRIGRTP